MAGQQWVSLLTPNNPQAHGAGAALSTATTATLSPTRGDTGDVAQVNAEGQYQGWHIGLPIRYTAQGFITTVATAGTLTFLLAARVGNAGATYITLATTAAINTPAAANTGIQWELTGFSRCTNVATSGNTISSMFKLVIGALAAQTILTATANVVVFGPNASGETAAAVDTTQLQGLSLRCTQVTSTCTVQLSQWFAETLA